MLNLQKIYNSFCKTPFIEKLFYILTIIIVSNIIIAIYSPTSNLQIYEGFEPNQEDYKDGKNFIVKYGPDIYDDFYVQIYDDLVFNKNKDNFEIMEIISKTSPSSSSNILDVGAGTGHHVKNINDNGYKCMGVDISHSMVAKAKENYPDMNYIQGDVLTTLIFQPNTFSHITCLYFTIYYMKDKKQFFDNCMSWLEPGGFLALHLVNRNKFDPVIPAGSPFNIVSPQNYSKERITSSVVVFNNFEYKSNFDFKFEDDLAILNETFKFNKDGRVRKNEHKFYMETQNTILGMAKDSGFIFSAEISMLNCQYEHQSIYILQKPN